MTINLLFFSVLRDAVGCDELRYSLSEKESQNSVSGLLRCLYTDYPQLQEWDSSLLIAINCEYADRDQSLCDGDEVALMPPVQGG